MRSTAGPGRPGQGNPAGTSKVAVRSMRHGRAEAIAVRCELTGATACGAVLENDMSGGFASPRISHLSWGRLEVDGLGAFKDAKLYPGGAREWDWRETGTRHVPGIQPADVLELLERGAEVVVLAKGVHERLRVCPETLALLKSRGIPAHVLPTEDAVRLYNELAAKRRVGGLIHSTC
jgi:hypothetical protein